jgi:hypothetical protein
MVPNLTVRNSRFQHCAVMDLFIERGTWWNQPLYGGLTIENNVFEHSNMLGINTWHYYSSVVSLQRPSSMSSAVFSSSR